MTSFSNKRRARPLLGTLVDIAVHGGAGITDRALARAFEAVSTVHALMSFHEGASDVSRLNREAWRRAVQVDEHTWRVLETAQSLSAASGGLFDVTVAPLLQRWGYLPRLPGIPPPHPDASWRDIELRGRRRVRFARALVVDLGGIAKGYAVDAAISALQAAGAEGGCVNAGGDLRAYGSAGRRVHIRHPARSGHWIDAGMLHDGAIATSACEAINAPAAAPVGALIHPHNRSRAGAFESVSVFAPSCMLADALTKVVMADATRAVPVLRHLGARALGVSGDELRATDPSVLEHAR